MPCLEYWVTYSHTMSAHMFALALIAIVSAAVPVSGSLMCYSRKDNRFDGELIVQEDGNIVRIGNLIVNTDINDPLQCVNAANTLNERIGDVNFDCRIIQGKPSAVSSMYLSVIYMYMRWVTFIVYQYQIMSHHCEHDTDILNEKIGHGVNFICNPITNVVFLNDCARDIEHLNNFISGSSPAPAPAAASEKDDSLKNSELVLIVIIGIIALVMLVSLVAIIVYAMRRKKDTSMYEMVSNPTKFFVL